MNYANKDEVVDWLRAYAELCKRRAAVSKRRDLMNGLINEGYVSLKGDKK